MWWCRLRQISRPHIRSRCARFWPRRSIPTGLVRRISQSPRDVVKRSNPYGVQMILPLLFLITLLGGCTSSDCKFGETPAKESVIPQGLGVNVHFTDPQPGEIKMIAAAGFRWVRMDFVWAETEKARGRYDFSAYDRLLESLRPYDIGALLILDYANPLYDGGAPPRTEEARRAFADWAAAAARHFAGRPVIWEVYNEPNNKMFWRPQPDVNEYVALALAVGRAFRADAPNEKLIGPATGLDWP